MLLVQKENQLLTLPFLHLPYNNSECKLQSSKQNTKGLAGVGNYFGDRAAFEFARM